MVKVDSAAVVWKSVSVKAKVQVSRLIVAPVTEAGSLIKLCPMLVPIPELPLLTELPMMVLRAKAEVEKAKVLARRAITPPRF
jgi:hypothetical protein